MSSYREDTLSVKDLLLDPNNYRFQDRKDYASAEEDRFHEESVQSRAERRLRDEDLVVLKNSILRNGFVPVERIVVREYPHKTGKFVVVEGNRRVAALKWIESDHLGGVAIADDVLQAVNSVPAVIVTEGDEVPPFHEALMGVRHVSGIKQWGGYQRAKLVAKHRDDYGLDPADVGERLGLSTQEVNRRYRAFKALQQMKESEEYGAYAKPELYPLFNEAVGSPAIRTWLGWDERSSTFTNEETIEQLYDLITPNQSDEGSTRPPKVTTYDQVREMRTILADEQAKQLLLDPAHSFYDAIAAAKQQALSRTWPSQVASAIKALDSMTVTQIKSLSSNERKQLEKLRDLAASLLEDAAKLTS
jgi:hypothetical protein